MNHTLELSEAAYQALTELAAQQGESPQAVLEALIVSARSNGPYYETEDWFRHLGVSEERIRKARGRAADDADA